MTNSREITFLVDDAVLSNLSPEMGSDEPAVLAAFDRHRDRVLELARSLYSGIPGGGRQNMYTIS